jgi:hypothetical protein
MRTGAKRMLQAGLLAGIAYGAWRVLQAQTTDPGRDVSPDSAPFPFPAVPRPAVAVTPVSAEPIRTEPPAPVAAEPAGEPAAAFTEPGADGSCPATHPVKAKLASGIFHVPGGGNYERTKPDRCYVDADAALADGLRAAKR